MDTVAERLYQRCKVRREVSQPADLVVLLLARLVYEVPTQRPQAVARLVDALQGRRGMQGVDGSVDKVAAFVALLEEHLRINRTFKGTSFQPVHPALALATNGEGPRVDAFIDALAGAFTSAEAEQIRRHLWGTDRRPAFEVMLEHVLDWQVAGEPIAAPPAADRFAAAVAPPAAADRLAGDLRTAVADDPRRDLAGTLKEDLLVLAEETVGVAAFVTHAGRLLAFGLARYLVAGAGARPTLPVYAAPASDSHEGVRTLVHEIIEVHRAELAEALRAAFRDEVDRGLCEMGMDADPADESQARQAAGALFTWRNNVVPTGQFEARRSRYGSFVAMAEAYYWSEPRANNRFLRQQHAAYANMMKKAGLANSRSRYSHWHFYWLAPSLIETLLLTVQGRRREHRRLLLDDVLDDWRTRYGIAVLVDETWRDAYRACFPGMGSPESLDEANRRRLVEVLADRGRLHKNSDDFPWVLLRS